MPIEYSDDFFKVAKSLSPETEPGTRIRSGKNPLVAEDFLIQTGLEQAQVGEQDTDGIVKEKVQRVKLFKSVKESDVSPGGKARLARYVTYTYLSDGRVIKEFRVTPDGEPIKVKGQKELLSKRAAEQEVERYKKNGAKVDSSTSDTEAQDSNKAKRERDRNEKKLKRKDPKTSSVTVGSPIRDNSGQLAFDPREPRTAEILGDELDVRSDEVRTTRDRMDNPSRRRPGDDRALRGKREKSPGVSRGVDKTLGLEFGTTLGPKIDDGGGSKRTTRSLVPRRKKKSRKKRYENLSKEEKRQARKKERELKPGYAKKTRANQTIPTGKYGPKDVLGRNLARLRESAEQNPVVRVAAAQMKVDKQIEIQRQRLAELERSPGTYSRGKGEFDETARDRTNQDAALKDEDLTRREGRGGSGGRGYVANSTESQRIAQGEKRRIQNRIAKLRANKEALEIIEEVQAGDFSRAGNVGSLDEILKEIDLDESQDLSFDDDDLQKPRSRGGGAMSRTGMHPALAPGSLSDPKFAIDLYKDAPDFPNPRGGENPINRQFALQRDEASRPAPAPERILGAGNPRGTGNPIEMIDPQGRQLLAGTGKADQDAIRLTRMLKELEEGRTTRQASRALGGGIASAANRAAGARSEQNMVKELFRMLSGSVADTGVDKDEALKILSRIIRGTRMFG